MLSPFTLRKKKYLTLVFICQSNLFLFLCTLTHKKHGRKINIIIFLFHERIKNFDQQKKKEKICCCQQTLEHSTGDMIYLTKKVAMAVVYHFNLTCNHPSATVSSSLASK